MIQSFFLPLHEIIVIVDGVRRILIVHLKEVEKFDKKYKTLVSTLTTRLLTISLSSTRSLAFPFPLDFFVFSFFDFSMSILSKFNLTFRNSFNATKIKRKIVNKSFPRH